METRKIQLVGNRSYSISLPKKWVQENKLSAKDLVFIEPASNGALMVRASDTTALQSEQLSVALDEIHDIKGFLTLCYMKNMDNLVITADKFDLGSIRRIRQTVKSLEGYEVTAETPKKIEISFLFNEINITIDKITRRMIYLLSVMIESVEKKDHETLLEVEDTIDTLYNLARRILLRCLADDKFRDENKVGSVDTVFFLWDVFQELEALGDNVYKMKKLKCSAKEVGMIREMLVSLESVWIRKKEGIDLHKDLRDRMFPVEGEKLIVFRTIKKKVMDIAKYMNYMHMNSTLSK